MRLWDAGSGRERGSLLRHAEIIASLAFSPDGKILATSSKDRKVRLWQLASGQELVTLEGYTDTVMALAFSPNGEMLAGAGETYGKSEIYLWPAPRGNPIDEN